MLYTSALYNRLVDYIEKLYTMADQLIPRPMLEQAAERFRLLSEPVRLQLLNQLHTQGEMNVQALAEATGHHQANVSKHLRRLADSGLVEGRREGLYVYYSISDPILSALCVLVCSHLQSEEARVDTA